MLGLNGFLGQVDVELTGFEGMDEEEIVGLLGEISALPKNDPRRRLAVAKVVKKRNSGVISTNSLTAKAEFEKRVAMLPKEIQEDIRKGNLQLVDARLYSVKAAGGLSSIEMMANADVKAVGVTNVNNRKLDVGQYFLCTGIRITSAINASPLAAAFDVAATDVLNGEINLEVGSTKLLPENTPLSIFNTASRSDVQKGFYKLENPKFIVPSKEIKPELKFPVALTANTNIKIEFIGVTLEKGIF